MIKKAGFFTFIKKLHKYNISVYLVIGGQGAVVYQKNSPEESCCISVKVSSQWYALK